MTLSVPNADAGIAYQQLIATFGGSGGNTFSLTTGPNSLPSGLTLNSSSGVIGGQTSQLGNTGFIVS